VVREKSSRDRYRKLKRDITAKLTYERFNLQTAGVAKSASYRAALTKAALLPLTAVALPTIRESSDAAKRTLSDPQTPRTSRTRSLAGPSPPTCCRAGRSVRPMSLLRPSLAALPMRSWYSDDSNFLASCETRNDVTCRSGAAKRARLSRNARLDESTEAPVSAANIPIIISSPDNCDSELVTGDKSVELSSTERRSSCPFSTYDVNSEEKSSSSGRRNSSSSRKRRRDFALSDASHRRTSLQSITAPTCHFTSVDHEPEKTPADCTRTAQRHDGREKQQAVMGAAASAARANSECHHTSSLDVHWPTRRLSLPHSSTSSVTDDRSRLQLPSAP